MDHFCTVVEGILGLSMESAWSNGVWIFLVGSMDGMERTSLIFYVWGYFTVCLSSIYDDMGV